LNSRPRIHRLRVVEAVHEAHEKTRRHSAGRASACSADPCLRALYRYVRQLLLDLTETFARTQLAALDAKIAALRPALKLNG
jgi:hypothetical protein